MMSRTSIITSFSAYWRATKPKVYFFPLNFEVVVSIGTIVYVIAKLKEFEWTAIKLIGYIIISVILSILPFFHSTRFKNRLAALTAIALQVCLICMEAIIGRKQCMVSYLAYIILFRVMYYRTFFDNFALCLAFSSNVGATTRGEVGWYYNSNLMLWSYFFVALFLQHIYKRNALRLWQHVRLLISLNSRMKYERSRCEALISAHLPQDIIDQAYSSISLPIPVTECQQATTDLSQQDVQDRSSAEERSYAGRKSQSEHELHSQRSVDQGSTSDQTNSHNVNYHEISSIPSSDLLGYPPARAKTVQPLLSNKVVDTIDDIKTEKECRPKGKLIESALAHNIISDFDEGKVTVEMLSRLDHSDRRSSAIIAIRVGGGGSECALDLKIRNIIFALMDCVAEHYCITPVRRFGSTWIGCLGFFRSLQSDMMNCFAALQFCCYILSSLKKYDIELALALDFGNIIGGFVNSPHFELYGQEVRLVFQMTDLQQFGKIIIGDSARHQISLMKRLRQDSSVTVTTERIAVIPPWNPGAVTSCHCVTNVMDLLRKEPVDDTHLEGLFKLLSSCFDVELIDVFHESDGLDGFNEKESNAFLPTATTADKDKMGALKHPSIGVVDCGFDFDVLNYRPDYVDLINRWNAGRTTIQQHAKDSWYAYWDPTYWMEDLGIEFRTTVRERFGFDVEDYTKGCPNSIPCNEEEMAKKHEIMEKEIFEIVQSLFIANVKDFFTIQFHPESIDDVEIFATKTSLKIREKDQTRLFNSSPINLLIVPQLIDLIGCRWLLEGKKKEWWKMFSSPFHSMKYSKVAVDNNDCNPIHQDGKSCKVTRKLSDHGISGATLSKTLYQNEEITESKLSYADDNNKVNNLHATTGFEPLPSARSKVENGIIDDDSDDDTIGPLPYYRSWAKYAGDSRSIVHHSFFSFCINFAFAAVSYAVLRNCLLSPSVSKGFDLIGFLQLFTLHNMLSLTLERVYGRVGSMVMIILRALIFLSLPDNVLFHVLFSKDITRKEYGDFGGDVNMLLFLLFQVPSHMREDAILSLLDGVICRVIILIRQYIKNEVWFPQAHLSTILVLLGLDFCFWIIQHLAFVSYIVEHQLLPYALAQYREQAINTRKVIHILSPEAAFKFNKDIFKPNFYRNTALAVVHIKPADKLSGFLGPQDFCNIMDRVNEMVDEAFAESGLLKVSNFSGIHIAAVCKDASWDRITGLRVPSSHSARAVLFFRVIRDQLDKFCKQNNIHIAVGVGINVGPACLGFLGSNYYHFDIDCNARDRAVCMASYNADAFYASSQLEHELAKILPAEDLLHRLKVDDSWNDMYWIQIDSTYNGMQLNDFTYSGMLGKGGYGAVHLLCEKYTNKFYAIKAVPLKENSVMSRMMQRECIILQRMNHPNVVSLKCAFIERNQLYLVMDYLSSGNLKQVVDRDNPSLYVLKLWFAELVSAIEYVHSVGIIHRDIKPANCMIDGKGHLKLADFGLSKIVGAPQSVDTSSTNGLSTLGINEDVHAQLQKYLPPKAYLAGRDVPKKVFIVPILQILCGRDKSKSSRGRDTSFVTAEKIFGEESNLRIDVTTVKDRLFAVTLLHDKNIEAVFIDGGKGRLETQDLVDTVHYICTTLRSHIPIYVVNALSDVALQVIEAGAKECFEEMLDELDEVTYRRLFNIHYEPSQPPREGPIEPNHSLNPSNSTSTTTMLRSDLPRAGGEEEHSVVGTIHYIAPEVIHEHRYGEPVDWWALGISIYICIVRQHVFQGEGPAEVRDKIVGSDPDLLPLKAFDESAYDLVTKLLQKNPENRIGTIEGAMALREHPYFQGIDWTALPTMDMPLKPAEFKLGKYDLKEKLLFYGEPLIRDKIHMSMQELDERNSSSITRHKLNMQRVRRVVKNKHPLPSSSRYSQGKILGLSQGHSFLSTLDQSRDMETSDSGVVFTVPEEDENDEDREDINEPTGEQNVPIEARVRSFSDFASGTSCMMESM